jgi:hypothetical protein
MYHLVTLQEEPFDEVLGSNPRCHNVKPFMPAGTLNGAAAVDYTFAPNLRAYSDNGQYSVALIDLIFQCLYRDPGNRPDLMDLKRRAALGLEATFEDPLRLPSTVDNWNDFLHHPVNMNPPPPAARKKIKRQRRAQAANRQVQEGPSRTSLYFQPGTREMRCQALIKAGTQCKRTVRGPPEQNPRCKICKAKGL